MARLTLPDRQRPADGGYAQEEGVDSNLILVIIAAVLSLPGGLFMAELMSQARARWAALIGGIIGAAVIAAGIYFFVSTTRPSLDGLSYFLGSFFSCSMGVFAGALLANFLVGLGSRGPVTPAEY
jgi:hypothetical protein